MGVEQSLEDRRVLRGFLPQRGQRRNAPGPLVRCLLQIGTDEFDGEVRLWRRFLGTGEDLVAFRVVAELVRRLCRGEQVGQRGVDTVRGLEKSPLGIAPAALGEHHGPGEGPVARLRGTAPAEPPGYGETASRQAADQEADEVDRHGQ